MFYELVKLHYLIFDGSIVDDPVTSLALSNQAQFLLVNDNSVSWLTEKLPRDSDCPKVLLFNIKLALHFKCLYLETAVLQYL